MREPATVPLMRMRRRPRLRWLRRLGMSLMTVAVLAVAGGAILWMATPPVNDLEQRVTDRLAAHGLSQSSPPVDGRVALALIATEDSRFYQHAGIDVFALPRAALALVQRHGDLGGATLDQQLAKVIYSPVRTDLVAKMEQATLAIKIDNTYDKRTILRTYLNAVYFGHGYYGLADATQGYFGVAPDQVSWAQASLLAGLVQAPTAYDPLNHLDLAKQRQRHVLDRLVATGALRSAQADAEFAAPLQLQDQRQRPAAS